jgi:hypothetical protein
MLTLTTFLQDLIVSGTIVYVTYFFMRFTAYCLLWLIGKLSFKPGDNRRHHADRTAPSPVAENAVLVVTNDVRISSLRETSHASVE